ncbi:hypothetical protein BH09BAC5_BH09BAC5_29080 [soil metagenome]
MFSFLKNHPFAVETFFESSLVLTFAVPKEELEKLIPECLKLDTYKDKWAFIAIAMVQTNGLRPKGFPSFMGNDFFLIGYRIFVRYKNNEGKNLRGLYIIKSETNKKKMEFFGNIFTHYKYSTTDIKLTETKNIVSIQSQHSDFEISVKEDENANLPVNSPFSDWKEARKFAGPLPFTFTYEKRKKSVLIIEGVREDWNPKPVEVINFRFSFLDNLQLQNAVLANAFMIRNVPYYWRKGKVEIWNR